MSPAQANDSNAPAPIIVVRRPRGGDDGHHGGAWKIAYADFMTAMMALFLVLWLVNASSEETKAAVASYFNPIELTDRNARPRGLDDPVSGISAMGGGMGERSEEGDGTAPPSPTGEMREPGEPEAGGDSSEAGDASAFIPPTPETAADPFDPFALGAVSADPEIGAIAVEAIVVAERASAAKDTAVDGSETASVETTPIEADEAAADPPDTFADPAADPEPVENMLGIASQEAVERSAALASEALAASIAAELADTLGTASVEVVAEADTVVIRLADDPDRAMFAIGSDRPRPGLADDLARVAASLRERAGAISIHGHTDARPFPGRPDGNWRLSADRAGRAQALLVRGGLDPRRVASVVAHADREPRVADPLAPANRRIELRLAAGKAP